MSKIRWTLGSNGLVASVDDDAYLLRLFFNGKNYDLKICAGDNFEDDKFRQKQFSDVIDGFNSIDDPKSLDHLLAEFEDILPHYLAEFEDSSPEVPDASVLYHVTKDGKVHTHDIARQDEDGYSILMSPPGETPAFYRGVEPNEANGPVYFLDKEKAEAKAASILKRKSKSK